MKRLGFLFFVLVNPWVWSQHATVLGQYEVLYPNQYGVVLQLHEHATYQYVEYAQHTYHPKKVVKGFFEWDSIQKVVWLKGTLPKHLSAKWLYENGKLVAQEEKKCGVVTLYKNPQPLLHKYWKLISYGKQRTFPRKERDIYLIFNEKEVKGFSGCTSFKGTFQIATTALYCTFYPTESVPCKHAEWEKQFIKDLQSPLFYEIRQDELYVLRPNRKVIAKFEAVWLK